MKTLFRFFFIGIAAAIGFVVLAVIAFITFFDANAYKDDLALLVKQQTGRELVFIGDVSLTFYPDLGMKLGALTFSNPEGFGQRPMARVTESSVSVNVASLFAMKPEIDTFVLRGLEVDLVTRQDGLNNWDDLAASGAKPAADDEPVSPSGPSGSGGEPMTIEGAFGGLLIEDAAVRYQDQQTAADYQVKRFNLTTGRITPDAPFPLELSAVLSSAGQIDARIELSGGFQYLFDTGVVNIRDLSFSTNAGGAMLPVEDLTLDMKSAALSFNPAASTLTMSGLELNSNAIGDVLPLGKITTGISGENVALDLNARSLVIDGLQLAIDDLRLNGNLKVLDYAQPAVTFKLATSNLDIDALLGTPPPQPPAEGVAAEPEPVETGSAEDVQISLPVELMRDLFVDGEITAARAKVQNVRLQNVTVGIKANEGLVRLNPLSLDLYDGTYDGSVAINVRERQPVYQVRQNLEAVQVGDLLNDFMLLDQIGGAMTASIDLGTRGEWLSELKRNSNGNVSLNFKDGALKGFNLRHSIEQARAKLEQREPPQMEMLQTDFSALDISGVIKNGVFSSDDLNLQAPLVRVGGKGDANLNNNTVDYTVTAKLVGTVEGQDAGTVGDLSGLLIPVRIKGPFSSPGIDVRYNELLDDAIDAEKAKLAAEVEKQKQELQQQLDQEKKKLERAKKREQRKLKEKQELEAQRAKQQLEEEKKKAKKQLEQKLEDELQKLSQ